MAPSKSKAPVFSALPSVVLALRILTLLLLAAALAVMATDKFSLSPMQDYLLDVRALIQAVPMQMQKITFADVYAYRYVVAVAAAGCAYTLVQIPFAVVSAIRGRRLTGGSEGAALFIISADVVFALAIATGSAAGFGFTLDAKRYADYNYNAWQKLEALKGDWSLDDNFTSFHRDTNRFSVMAYTSSGLMLGAAASMASMIIISAHSLVG